VDTLFLCEDHDRYEIRDGLALVYGNVDPMQADYVGACLERSGLHPYLHSRRRPYDLLPGSGTDPFSGTAEATEAPIETEVRVPCHEILEAEEILRGLDFLP